MSPKEKFDGCMKQVDFYTQRTYNRQGYQWKVTIGLWTVLILASGFLFGKQLPPIPTWFSWIILLGYTFTWVRGIAAKTHDDQRAAHHFRHEAEALLLDGAHTVAPLTEETRTIRTLRWCFQWTLVWAHVFEVLATALIILASTSLLTWKPPHCP